MFKKEKDGMKEFSKEELQNTLARVKELSTEELESVVGGDGDDREYFTTDKNEIELDIFGSRF